MSVTVCRWVKLTWMDEFCLLSQTSTGLVNCCLTAEITCLSLIATTIAFYCWTVNYNYNASSSTQTVGCQDDYGTISSLQNSTSYTAAEVSGGVLTSSRCSTLITDSLLIHSNSTHRCITLSTVSVSHFWMNRLLLLLLLLMAYSSWASLSPQSITSSPHRQ